MRLPQNCDNMTELRTEIDALDNELVALLARRVAYVDRAAEIKARDGLPANIPSRVEEVIQKTKSRASEHGLSSDLVETLWRAMIEWSIAREEVALSAKGK